MSARATGWAPASQANLYGYGRLAWNPNLSAAAISDEWTRLSFGNDPRSRDVNKLELESWHIYESYTGPLGVGALTDITGPHSVRGSVRRAQRLGHSGFAPTRRHWHGSHGCDGTGYIGQYPPAAGREVRIAEDLPGRASALHAPRAVHAIGCTPARR